MGGIEFLGDNRIRAFVVEPDRLTGFCTQNDVRPYVARIKDVTILAAKLNDRIAGRKQLNSDLTQIIVDIAHQVSNGIESDAKGIIEKFEEREGKLFMIALLREEFYNDIKPMYDDNGKLIRPAKYMHTSLESNGNVAEGETIDYFPHVSGKIEGEYKIVDIEDISRVSLVNNPAMAQTIKFSIKENDMKKEEKNLFSEVKVKQVEVSPEKLMDSETKEVPAQETKENIYDKTFSVLSDEDKEKILKTFVAEKLQDESPVTEKEVSMSALKHENETLKKQISVLSEAIYDQSDISDIIGEEKYKYMKENTDPMVLFSIAKTMRGLQNKKDKEDITASQSYMSNDPFVKFKYGSDTANKEDSDESPKTVSADEIKFQVEKIKAEKGLSHADAYAAVINRK